MVATIEGVSVTAVWAPATGAQGPPYIPFAVDWPGAAAGQLVLLPIFARSTQPPAVNPVTIPLVSGYTLRSTDNAAGTNVTGEIQAKVAGASEAAPTVTSTVEDTQPTGAIAIVVAGWSGDLANVVVTQDVGANSNPICPAGTAPVDDCLVLRGVFVADDNPPSDPVGVTGFFAEITDHGSDAAMAWLVEDVPAAAGAVSSRSIPLTAGSDGWMTFTIVISPGGGDVEPAEGAAATSLVLEVSAVGNHRSAGAVSTGLALATSASGGRPSRGSAATSLALAGSAAGARASRGAASTQLVLAVSASSAPPAVPGDLVAGAADPALSAGANDSALVAGATIPTLTAA